MSTTLRHVGIVVSDVSTMTTFYRDLLGFSQEKRAVESGDFIDTILGASAVRVTTVKLTSPSGGMIELLHFESPQSSVGAAKPRTTLFSMGLTHIALTVHNLDQLCTTLSRAGIRCVAPPAVSVDGLAKVAFCRDPEDNYLELVEPLYATQ